jgi:hypothetical protein
MEENKKEKKIQIGCFLTGPRRNIPTYLNMQDHSCEPSASMQSQKKFGLSMRISDPHLVMSIGSPAG